MITANFHARWRITRPRVDPHIRAPVVRCGVLKQGRGVTPYKWHSTDVRGEWPPFSVPLGI